jgi:anhydro-N-acetylmuramic acid kinase
MVYKVIGLMSGSSLDGLDMVYTLLEETRGAWKFTIQEAECIPYDQKMIAELRHTPQMEVSQFLRLHTRYGRFLGEQVLEFMARHNLAHKVDFIATHGHTVFHEPAEHTSFQIGDGASIAAVTGLPVISDLRSLDVALGGQGAPIVPIGDQLLFGGFDYWLNIGGIANITVREKGNLLAFDVCAANQILNTLAEKAGQVMDQGGQMARRGALLGDVLSKINEQAYFQQYPPKSLSNEQARSLSFPYLLESQQNPEDLLRTAVQHIVDQITAAVQLFPHQKEKAQLLVTGGGAFNSFLIKELQSALEEHKVEVIVPDETVVKFKEALIMALIGALRWREETNVLSSVTGASKDSVSGALWMGQGYN